MDVIHKKRPKTNPSDQVKGGTHPAVSWLAIVVGVFLTAIGILLLLWGLSWQGASEESDLTNPDTGVGGPILLPLGVFVIAVGIIWILNGYHVFGRRRGDSRSCPKCGRPVEGDLAFCYHCGAEVPDEKPRSSIRPHPRR